MTEPKHYVSDLPACVQRVGRIWDNADGIHKAVMVCGGKHEVSVPECMKCKGFTNPMLRTEMKGW